MNFKIPDADYVYKYGTSLQGYVGVPPATLVKVFGLPPNHVSEDDATISEIMEEELSYCKTTAEWSFISDKGDEVHIYDYKFCREYTGDDGDPTARELIKWESSFSWHIGAKNETVADEFCKWILKKVG